MDTPTLVDTREAAQLLGVHPRTIRRAAADGALRPVRLREWSPLRFRRDDLEAFLAADRDPREVDTAGMSAAGLDNLRPASGSADASVRTSSNSDRVSPHA
jgi:excisionase family DNA binding protein